MREIKEENEYICSWKLQKRYQDSCQWGRCYRIENQEQRTGKSDTSIDGAL